MAIIISNDGNKDVANIAARDALTYKFPGMEVFVLDTVADPLTGGGSACYKWNAITNKWMLMWKNSKDSLMFTFESKTIVNGQVTADFLPKDGIIWETRILNELGVIIGDIHPVVIDSVITLGEGTYDGLTLEYNYAYGTTEFNPHALTENVGTPGTYKSVTTDPQGRVTAGTNPTTLVGYGITDAAPVANPTFTGTVNGITKTMVGLSNVDNTSDTNKPVSTAQQTALDLKANLISPSFTTPVLGTPVSGNFSTGTFTWPTFNQSTTGNAATVTTNANLTGDDVTSIGNVTTLASVGIAGTYKSVTTDAKGRITAGTNPTTLAGYGITDATSSSHSTDYILHLTSAQNTWLDTITVSATEVNYLTGVTSTIQTQLNNKLSLTGGTITSGNLIMSAGTKITLTDAPSVGTDAVNKNYVDANLAGLTWKNSVKVATTTDITLSAPQTIDNISVIAGDRVLVKNQSTSSQNGIYVANVSTWTRAIDMDSTTPINELNSAAVFVEQGTLNQDTGWTQINNITTLGTDSIAFTQFNGAAGITAGVGLLKTGNVLDVNLGAGIVQLPTDEVGVDLYSTGGLMTTVDGTTSSTLTNSQLSLTKVGTAGTYKSVTTDVYGRITAGTNPTTLSGYGITDAAPIASPTFTGTVSGITATMIGLGNVTNTSDANKPVSTAQQTALNLKQDNSNKDASDGYSGLTLFKINFKNTANTFTNFLTNTTTAARTYTFPDKDITIAGLSDITGTNSGTNTGDNAINSLYSGLATSKANIASPTFTGTVSGITATMVGLGNVTNTSDANKPVSTAQQTALDLKANIASPTFTGTVSGITATMVGLGNVTNTSDANKPVSTAQQTALDLKENSANKDTSGGYSGLTLFKINFKNTANTFTNFLTNTTTAARTYTFPDKDITVAGLSDITGTNTGTNTGDNAVNTLYSGLAASKANIASPTFTGTVSGITATMVGLGNVTNTSDANKPVSTAQQTALDLKANLISPSFTTPALGTPSSGVLTNCTGTAAGLTAGNVTTNANLTGDITSVGNATTLASVGTAGTYKSITTDAKGRVTAGTNPTTLAGYGITDASPSSHLTDYILHLTSAQNTWLDTITATAAELNYSIGVTSAIQTQLGTKLALAGGTMSGTIVIPTGSKITLTDAPSLGTDAVNKNYVDANLAGLTWKNSVKVATTTNITLSAPQTIDDIPVIAGNRVLVKDQSTASQNGIYVVNAGAWTRATDMDSTTPINELNSAAVFVEQGTLLSDTGWTQISNITTLGTDPITFVQFNGAANITAGIGLLKTGNTLAVNLGAGIIQLPTDEVGIDVYSTGGLMTTVDGTAVSTLTNAQLSLTKVGTAGTYKSVTTDVYGRITAGTNPTTLLGYGITDAAPIANPVFTGIIEGTQLLLSAASVVSKIVAGAGSAWYCSFVRNDGANVYLLSSAVQITQAAAETATWNAYRPFSWNLSTGAVSIAGGGCTLAIGGNITGSGSLTLTGAITASNLSGTNTGDNAPNTLYSGVVTNANHTGDVTGATALTIANTGVVANTYRSVTVNAKGQITAGTNPTTLAGYGITDASPSSHLIDYGLHLTTAQNVWIDAITAGSAEVNYLAGTTSSIQTQFNAKQPLDADLTAITALAGTTGLLQKTAADTWTLNTSTYLTGNQTITVTGDVTGSGTTAITLNLGNSGITAGTYKSLTVDAKGRVTAGTNPTTLAGYGITDATASSHITDATLHLTSAQNTWLDAITATAIEMNYVDGVTSAIQTQLGTKLPLAGGTMSGTIVIPTGSKITLTDAPVAGTDAVNKNYLDTRIVGLAWKAAVTCASTANIVLATGTLLTIDTIVTTAGMRVLVKNQTLPKENGIYIAGTGAWARATDMDIAAEFTGATVFVTDGSLNVSTGWTQSLVVTTLGTDPITFVQFNGTATTTAGIGLLKTGNVLDVNLGAGIVQLPTDEVGVDVYSTGGLMNTVDGTASSTVTASQLSLTKVGTAGTYRSVTTNAHGRVTAGTNPTTLSGYGITDAAPIASPTFTGIPAGPTAIGGTNTTQLATCQFVNENVSGYLLKTTTGGTTTLTSDEAGMAIIAVNGALTSNAIVVVPGVPTKSWLINNATTGAFTLTVKTSAGTGVGIAQGKRNFVYSDGTNVLDAFNDFEAIALTGVSTAPTAAAGTNTTQIATTAFATTANALKSNLVSPTFTGNVGMGAAADTNTRLQLSGTLGGSTSTVSLHNSTVISSEVTAAAYGITSSLSTQAAVFTVPAAYHFIANALTLGAGSIVSNQFGFYANSSLTAATNNFGFYSALTAATGRWSIYTGTAASYFGGTVTSNDQFQVTGANDVATGGGQIYLNGATGNRIDFNANGIAAPTFTSRSVGTKLVLNSGIGATSADYAIGMESGCLWNSVPTTAYIFKWYGGTTLSATLSGSGNLSVTGSLSCSAANDVLTGGGQIYLNGTVGNRIDFNINGVAAPTFTTRSVGTKICLYSGIGATSTDFAIGIEGSCLWNSVSTVGSVFKWYGGTTLAATLTGAGALTLAGSITATSFIGAATTATSLVTTNNYQVNSLGIGTAASGIAGELRATNNITAYYSDERLKTNVKIIDNALEKVKKLSGITFTSNELAATYGYTDTKEQVGLLAQQVETVLPQVVVPAPFDIAQDPDGIEYSKSGENYLTIQYEKLIPLLVEAIKDLSKEVEILKKQIVS